MAPRMPLRRNRSPSIRIPYSTAARAARRSADIRPFAGHGVIGSIVMEQEKKKRPPWWFAPVVWGGVAASAAAAALVIGGTQG